MGIMRATSALACSRVTPGLRRARAFVAEIAQEHFVAVPLEREEIREDSRQSRK